MNVCMLAYTYYEQDNRVMRYAETLAGRGDHVDVIAVRRPHEAPFCTVNGVNVFKIQVRVPDERRKWTYLLRIVSFLYRAARCVAVHQRQIPYDLVHVHSVPDFLVYAAAPAKRGGAKVILDIHDVLPELYATKFGSAKDSLVYKALVRVERLCARFADHVIIANDLWRNKMIARSVPRDKCTTIMNYPDRDIFRPGRRTQSNGNFTILYPGTLSWHQGLDVAIRAFARISDKAPQAEFHIYGRGTEKTALQELVQELRLKDRIFFHDPVPLRDMAQIMGNADLGVVPKRGDCFGGEAFSTKTLEFMSLGVPLVVAATPIDRYYFNDSLVKFFPCGDDAELAAAMLQLIQDDNMRRQMETNGLDFARQHDWQLNQSCYLRLVDSLVFSGTKAMSVLVGIH